MALTVRTQAITKKSTQNRLLLASHGAKILEQVAQELFEHANNTIIPALRAVEDTVPLRQPRQIYIRTGNISRGWHTEPRDFDLDAIGARSSALVVRIVNDVIDTGGGYRRYGRNLRWVVDEFTGEEYADQVMGDHQRNIHKGRWPLAADIVRRYAPALNGRVHVAIRRGLNAV